MTTLRTSCSRCLAGVAAAVLVAMAGPAQADSLPGALVEAVKAMPAAAEGRQACMMVHGLANARSIPVAIGEQDTSVSGGGYGEDTKGAYLGDLAAGMPTPPFIQALIDAGVARKVPLTWTTTARSFGPVMPHLQDTGAARQSEGNTPPVAMTATDTAQGYAFIAPGDAGEVFVPETNRFVVDAPAPPEIGAVGRAHVPAGIWRTDRICYQVKPVRVLEYGDPAGHEDGPKTVSAAILFRPDPALDLDWMRDPRITAALSAYLLPEDVRIVSFRDDGDGWRVMPYPMRLFGVAGAVRTHVPD